jgi:hypothetical protein
MRQIAVQFAVTLSNRCMRDMVFPAANVLDRMVWRSVHHAVDLMAARIVTVVPSAVTARETEEGHRRHAGGAEYHAEDVEIHCQVRRYPLE